MDLLLSSLYVLLPLALARGSLGLRYEYQNKIEIFDESFSKQFSKLTKLKTIEGVDYLGKILGVSCLLLFVMFLISSQIFGVKMVDQPFLAKSFIYTLIGFFSIKWYTKPDKFSFKFLKDMSQVAVLALLLPLVDVFMGIRYTPIVYESLLSHAAIIGLSLPSSPNVFLMAGMISTYMLLGMASLWLVTSALMALYFIPVFTVSYGLLKLCGLLEKLWGKNTLNGLLVVAVIATQYYSWYKN